MDLRISRLKLVVRELVWKLHTASFRRYVKFRKKIIKEWETTRDSIWLPNFFEGKDPFDGRSTDEKGLPAGGIDKRGAVVAPTVASKKVEDDTTEF